MNKQLLEIYTDYLTSSFSYTTATGLSILVEGVIIADDTIEEKPSTDENEIVSWHYDHSKGRNVK